MEIIIESYVKSKSNRLKTISDDFLLIYVDYFSKQYKRFLLTDIEKIYIEFTKNYWKNSLKLFILLLGINIVAWNFTVFMVFVFVSSLSLIVFNIQIVAAAKNYKLVIKLKDKSVYEFKIASSSKKYVVYKINEVRSICSKLENKKWNPKEYMHFKNGC